MKQLLGFILLFIVQATYSQQKYQVLKNSTDSNSIVTKVQAIQELEVVSRQPLTNIKSSSMGISIDVMELKKLPNVIGDADPFKSLQYMGGISQAGDASGNMNVRGGDNDQNLILLNGSQVESPMHVLGLFSVFNPDLIDQMQYIKSGIPAEYGGKLSSVIDIKNYLNTSSKLELDGNVGLIASRLSIKSALSKNFSVYAAHRVSYIGSVVMPMLVRLGIDSLLSRNNFDFSDTNFGFNYRLNPNTRLSGHFYTGKDMIKIAENTKYSVGDNSSQWGNRVWGFQLTHLFSEKLSMTHALNSTYFNLSSKFNWMTKPYQVRSEKSAFNLKSDFIYLSGNHNLKAGIDLSTSKLLPFFIEIGFTDSLAQMPTYSQSADAALYLRDEWEIGRLMVNVGLRGGFHFNYFDSKLSSPISFSEDIKLRKTYFGFEPRFSGRWMLSDESSLKISATKHFQYSNRLQLIKLGLPIEIFITASDKIKPSSLWHYSTGYFRSLNQNSWEISLEAYYKSYSNLLEYGGNLNNFFSGDKIDDALEVGRAYAYGTEFMIRKNGDRFNGWFNYTLGWNYRKFDAINNGLPYLATNDRRHDLSLVGLYKINKRLDITAKFVYASGNRLNLPRSWYIIDNSVVLEFSKYNSFSMPDYHRLDVSLIYKLPSHRKLKSEINFSVYNLYNRANPFQIHYSTSGIDGQYDYKIKMYYLIPILPSFSWTFHL